MDPRFHEDNTAETTSNIDTMVVINPLKNCRPGLDPGLRKRSDRNIQKDWTLQSDAF
jgi:hypothetical protein